MKFLRRLTATVASFFLAAVSPCQVAPATPPQGAVTTAPAKAIERPLLWRIELPTPSYLYGTIHLPDERVTTLPDVVTAAIDGSGALFTEIPMEMDKMMAAAKAAMLPKGTTLRDELGDELYGRVKAYVESRGGKMAMFDPVRPWVATTQLMIVDMLPKMATRRPLDLQLYADAKKAGKTVGGLETVESQMAVFEDLSHEEQVKMLESTLGKLEQDAAAGKSSTEELLQLYLKGDEAAIDTYINEYPLGDEKLQAKLEERLLANRNGGMVDRIVEQLQRFPDRSSFFAVGAAHYGGKEGVLAKLAERGYRVTRIELDSKGLDARREADAIDAEIARRTQEIEALRTRRGKLLLLR